MKKILKNTAVLTLITLIAGTLLGLVYEVTKEPIALAKEKAKQQAYMAVVEEADSFEDYKDFDADKAEALLNDAGLTACDVVEAAIAKKGNEEIGAVVTVVDHEGYGGDIKISVGILSDGTVKGIEMLEISETAGLGMKSTEPEFKDQFKDKNVEKFVYTKSDASADNEIDALSGATITTNAVTNGVNAALTYFAGEIGGNVR